MFRPGSKRAALTVLVAAVLVAGCAAQPDPAPEAPPTAQPPFPDPPRTDGPTYVAMGDSAAAAPLVPDQAAPAGCFKSTNNYPAVLARTIGAASFTDVTCSGARTADLVSRAQSTHSGPVRPQLDAVTSDTELVTITIGGNDVDLAGTATACRRATLDVPPCAADLVVDGVDTLSQAIADRADEWGALVDTVRAKAPDARVILVGYGTYVRPQGCFPEQPINPVDAAYFQARLDELDDRLAGVAADRGVEFFDPRPLSVGHDICAPPQERFIEGFVVTTPAAPLHPNARGAAAFGAALADYVAAGPSG